MTTPAQDAGPRHAEIDRRVRSTAKCVWVLNIVAALIFLCCIVSWITMGIDLRKDRTVEVAPSSPGGGGGGGDGDEPPPSVCDDGNSCTLDFERILGGCEYRRRKTNSVCDSTCFDETIGGPLRCQLVEGCHGLPVPMCMGTRTQCRGFCHTAGDCPADLYLEYVDLSSGPEPLFGPEPLEPQCVGGSCIYQYQPFSPEDAVSPFETCLNQSSDIQETWCDKVLQYKGPEENDYLDCLTTEYICNENNLPICVKYFHCSIPCIGVEPGGAARWIEQPIVDPPPPMARTPQQPPVMSPNYPQNSRMPAGRANPRPGLPHTLPPGIRLPPKTM